MRWRAPGHHQLAVQTLLDDAFEPFESCEQELAWILTSLGKLDPAALVGGQGFAQLRAWTSRTTCVQNLP